MSFITLFFALHEDVKGRDRERKATYTKHKSGTQITQTNSVVNPVIYRSDNHILQSILIDRLKKMQCLLIQTEQRAVNDI